jgi:hypothetical protein
MNVGDILQVDGHGCKVACLSTDTRAIVALEPGIYALAVLSGDGVWSVLTGEPGNETERALLKRLADSTPDTLTVTKDPE